MRKLGENNIVIEDAKKTKNRILLESARLFAVNGYAAVSVREIAEATGIRQGAIYNHYNGKETVLDSILDKGIQVLKEFYHILYEENKKAETVRDIVYNIFVELNDVTSQFIYYAISTAINTQFMFEKSRNLYFDTFLIEGKASMKMQLDLAIECNMIAPFDTTAVASLIMGSVITGNTLRVGQFNGYYQDFDLQEWYTRQAEFILDTVKIMKPQM